MICVLSIFILLKGVNLDPKRHSLFTSMLPWSKFCADAMYLKNNSKRIQTTVCWILFPPGCPVTSKNSRSSKTNSHIICHECLIPASFWTFWEWALLPYSNASPLTQDLARLWVPGAELHTSPTSTWEFLLSSCKSTLGCSRTEGPEFCMWLNPQQPSSHHSEFPLFTFYCRYATLPDHRTAVPTYKTWDTLSGEFPPSRKPTTCPTCIHLNFCQPFKVHWGSWGRFSSSTTSAPSPSTTTMKTALGHLTGLVTRLLVISGCYISCLLLTQS